jgi:hypothetical protein
VHAPTPDQQFRSHRTVGVCGVQVGAATRSTAEHRIEVERRGAGVRGRQWVLRHAELGSLVEGDVVVGELADKGRPCGHGWVVRIASVRLASRRVAVHGRVDDEVLRAGCEIVVGVHDAALATHLEERGAHGIARIRKRRE